jgi:hypothetical protein
MNADLNDLDLGDDFMITKTPRRASGAGAWVCGRLNGHRFEALVFPEHAENPEWEIGDSRISKLWLQRLAGDPSRCPYIWRSSDVFRRWQSPHSTCVLPISNRQSGRT